MSRVIQHQHQVKVSTQKKAEPNFCNKSIKPQKQGKMVPPTGEGQYVIKQINCSGHQVSKWGQMATTTQRQGWRWWRLVEQMLHLWDHQHSQPTWQGTTGAATHRRSKQHSHIFTRTPLPSEHGARLSLHFRVTVMLLDLATVHLPVNEQWEVNHPSWFMVQFQIIYFFFVFLIRSF